MTEEKLLVEEIQDLSRYLDGVPEYLRASGALAAYDARLNMLQQQLLAARLQRLLKYTLKYSEEGLNKLPPGMPSFSLTDPKALTLLKAECHRVEKSHYQAARAYSTMSFWINLAVLLSLAAVVGIVTWSGELFWAISLIVLGASLTALEFLLGLAKRPLQEQMIADRLTAIRLELDTLSAKGREERLEAKDVNESAMRMIRLLDETSGGVEASPGKVTSNLLQ